MTDGVGSHHQLEGVVVLEDVLLDEAGPPAGAVLFLELADGLLTGAGHERHGARRRVEQGDALGGQAVGALKFRLQQLVQRSNDVRDHGLRGVVDPAALALLGIIDGQERLVEVDDRVAPLPLAVVALQDALGVGGSQHCGDIVHDPLQLLGEVAQGDEAEDVPQDADRAGDQVKGRAAVEILIRAGAGGEQPICDRLGVQIRKVLRAEVGDQESLEGFVEPEERALSLLLFGAQLLDHDLAEEASALGQGHRELLRRVGLREREREELLQEFAECVDVFRGRHPPELVEDKRPPDRNAIDQFPFPVEPKLEEVGEEQIGEGATIPLQLLRCLDGFQVFHGGGFSLDVADDAVLAVPDAEVGVARFRLLRQGRDRDLAPPYGLGTFKEKRFETGVEALLPGISPTGNLG